MDQIETIIKKTNMKNNDALLRLKNMKRKSK